MDLSVVMISKNEEKAIGKVVTDIKKSLKSFKGTWEIFLVDSSKDKTAEIAKGMGVRVEKQIPPRGYGRAMIRALTEAKGNVIITLDCDDTYPASLIPTLYKLCREEYDVVGTNRIWKKSPSMPLGNYLANKAFSTMASLFYLRNAGDIHTGMRAYRKKLIEESEKYLDPSFDALPVDLICVPLRKGCKFKDINIEYKNRVGQTTLNKLDAVLSTIRRIVMTRFRRL